MNGKDRQHTISEVRSALKSFKDPNYEVMADVLIAHADGMAENLSIFDILIKGANHPFNREDIERLLEVLDEQTNE